MIVCCNHLLYIEDQEIKNLHEGCIKADHITWKIQEIKESTLGLYLKKSHHVDESVNKKTHIWTAYIMTKSHKLLITYSKLIAHYAFVKCNNI